MLFSIGGLFALTEGIEKLRHPHEIESVWVAIGILLFAIALETYSLRTAIKEVKHVKPVGVGWWQFIRTSKQPELPVVLLEDIGAEVGLFAALGGVAMAEITGNPRWDAAGSVVIGVLLIVIAIVLMIEMKGLLIGESASQSDQDAIVAALTAGPDVTSLIHLKTQHIGPDEILVAAKLEFDAALTFAQLTDSINAAERQSARCGPRGAADLHRARQAHPADLVTGHATPETAVGDERRRRGVPSLTGLRRPVDGGRRRPSSGSCRRSPPSPPPR